MVVPMKNQYEQYYNAIALKELKVPVLKNIKKKRLETIAEWIESDTVINIEYPDITEQAVNDAVTIGKAL
jgi:hypothetical protein